MRHGVTYPESRLLTVCVDLNGLSGPFVFAVGIPQYAAIVVIGCGPCRKLLLATTACEGVLSDEYL